MALRPFLNASEVARALNVSRHTVYKWTRNGSIPFVQVGKSTRYRRSVVERLLGTEQATPACCKCRWWLRDVDGGRDTTHNFGECRRFPGTGEPMVWPLSKCGDFCGEFTVRIT